MMVPSDAGRRLRRLGFAALAAGRIRDLSPPEVRWAACALMIGMI